MSIRRLWVRISKCSRESLSLNGDRITQYTFFSVGSGTGPDTLAPVRVAVSTISLAADSIAEVSYAFRRMRILFWVVAAILFSRIYLSLRLGLIWVDALSDGGDSPPGPPLRAQKGRARVGIPSPRPSGGAFFVVSDY